MSCNIPSPTDTITKTIGMALELTNYKKFFSERLILEIPELSLGHGIYWIKGDNGSGKSTLFKSIGGLISFHGTIRFNELSCKRDYQHYRQIVSYSEAEPTYPDFLSLRDLIAFYSKTLRAQKEHVAELIQQFNPLSFLNNPVSTYSSGMLKKTGLLLAFIGNPQLIILDEPFITIDKKTTQVLEKLILDRYQAGATFLISSHMPEGALQLPITKTYWVKDSKLERV